MNVTCNDDPDLDGVWLVTPVGNLDATGATHL